MVIINASAARLCLPCYGSLFSSVTNKSKKRRKRGWPAMVAKACSVSVVGSCLVRRKCSTSSIRHRPVCSARVYRRTCSCPIPPVPDQRTSMTAISAFVSKPRRMMRYYGRSLSAPLFVGSAHNGVPQQRRLSRGWSGRRKAIRYRDRSLLPYKFRYLILNFLFDNPDRVVFLPDIFPTATWADTAKIFSLARSLVMTIYGAVNFKP